MSDPRSDHPSDLLSAYLDDELPFEERDRVDHHLAECAACRSELDALHLLAAAVAAEAAPGVPADLAARIGAHIDRAQVVPIRSKRRFLIPVSVAASLAAVFLLVAFQWREGTFRPASAPPPELDRDRGAIPLQELEAPRTDTQVAEPPASSAPDLEKKAKSDLGQASPVPASLASPAADLADRAKGFVRPANEAVAAATGGSGFAREVAISAPAGSRFMQDTVSGLAPQPEQAPCGDSWIDSGRLAAWDVRDDVAAVTDLDALAHASGGRGTVRRWADGTTYEMDVPRARYDELLIALRTKGVTGLDAPAPPIEGGVCVRQRIEISVRESGTEN